MTLYNMYIFNRAGYCLYYQEWSRPQFMLADDPDEDKKLMFGMLFSLKDLTSKMSPGASKEGIHTIRMGNFTMHHFESLTGIVMVVNTDNSVGDLYFALKHVYTKFLVECVNRNPLYDTSQANGKMITSTIFTQRINTYLPETVAKTKR